MKGATNMKKLLKALAITTVAIGVATAIKRVNGLQTQMDEIKDGLNLKVNKNQIIEHINVSPEDINIANSKLEDR